MEKGVYIEVNKIDGLDDGLNKKDEFRETIKEKLMEEFEIKLINAQYDGEEHIHSMNEKELLFKDYKNSCSLVHHGVVQDKVEVNKPIAV